jgi:Cu2+-exporting ATPase
MKDMENMDKKMYTCPMHPDVMQDRPGHCPDCGMNLVPMKMKMPSSEHGEHSHDKHAGHSTNMFRTRFWVSLVLTIPITLYSSMVQSWLHFSAPRFPGSAWIPFVLGTIIFFYGGVVFLTSAWREIRGRQPGMMTLISLAIISAYAYSIATTFFISGTEFFWELSTLITIMLLGHWIEMRSVKSAQGAMQELAKLLPDMAELADGKKIPISELKAGDIVVVRPGGHIPADGVVIEGESEVNESMITGESNPIQKVKDSKVIAGTVNGNGSLKLKVMKVGEATALAGIMRLVAEAQQSQSHAQELADRAAFYLTIVAIVAGAGTFFGWLIAGYGLGFALERMVTVLVIACPHALGLAVPLVVAISTTLGARKGLLVRKRIALENARNLDVILFDKTGTLTKGEHGVADVWPCEGYDENKILTIAASVEASSEHSIGKALFAKAKEKNISLLEVKNFSALPGLGVQGDVNGKTIMVGGPQLLATKGIAITQTLKDKIVHAESDGKTINYVFENSALAGVITSADVVREESKQAVKELKDMGVRVAMLTGDSKAVAKSVADQLGITEYFAEVLPKDKTEKVKELQKDGSKVAMVGDGVNDAPALTQADIGIAIGAGTDVAIESAGIVLIKSDPRDVVNVIKLSKMTYRKMIQNLAWATGYNVIAIPLAAGVLASKGILLSPAIGAVLMSLSTVIVAFNAVLLKREGKNLS